MDELTKKSINIFTSELKSRISLLSSNEMTANIDNSNFSEVCELLSDITLKSPSDLTREDLKRLLEKNRKEALAKIKELLILCGQTKERVSSIVDILKQELNNDILDNIITSINDYIKEYQSIENSQQSLKENKTAEYQKYIDFFSHDELETPIDDTNELSKLMTSIGILEEDKWRILMYVAKKNVSLIQSNFKEIELELNKLDYELRTYVTKEEIDKIKAQLGVLDDNEVIDVDDISDAVSKTTKIDSKKVKNAIVVCLAEHYEKALESGSTNRDEMIETIDYLIAEYQNPRDLIISFSEEILNQNEENVDAYLKEFKDVDEIIDTDLTELTNIYGDDAIKIKEIPIIVSIKKVVSSIKEEYEDNHIEILKDLIAEYNELEEKKKEITYKL